MHSQQPKHSIRKEQKHWEPEGEELAKAGCPVPSKRDLRQVQGTWLQCHCFGPAGSTPIGAWLRDRIPQPHPCIRMCRIACRSLTNCVSAGNARMAAPSSPCVQHGRRARAQSIPNSPALASTRSKIRRILMFVQRKTQTTRTCTMQTVPAAWS